MLAILMSVQILGALGMGATLSVGALIAAGLGGDGWTGMAATLTTIGAAIFSIPLARLVPRRGRALSMTFGLGTATFGAMLAIAATQLRSFPLLLVSFVLLGAATAANLQARFAAADIASPETKSRDLSLVIWATTFGAVLGPNLMAPGSLLGQKLGITDLAGPFVITVVAQLLAIAVLIVGMRPDPALFVASRHEPDVAPVRENSTATKRIAGFPVPAVVGILAIAVAHLTMVGIMSITPLHLMHHGAGLTIVGITISLHVAGMYGLSPVFGFASDAIGKLGVIWIGIGILIASALALIFRPGTHLVVTIALVGVGLGWSAALVAGSALVAEGAQTRSEASNLQGTSDLLMNTAGALGGATAGPIMLWVGMPGVSALTIVILIATTIVIALLAKHSCTGF